MATSLKQGRWLAWLAGARLFWALVALNFLVTIAVAVATFHTISGDHYTYLGYADGLLQGRYTYWYFLPEYVPDTFRNPGYPLFLLLVKALGGGEIAARVVQVVLYLLTLGIVVKLAARCEPDSRSWLVRNLFLVLLLPNIQLAYFAAVIFPEVLVAFLIATYAYVALSWPVGAWKRTIALALLAGLIFQTRPIFILFPGLQLVLDFWQTWRKAAFSWLQAAALLVIFGATMLPYALWNYRHHGVLKPTSLEGGAGVMQIGFWALRMPGYHETRYWGNQMGDEIISFVEPTAVPGYIAAFNQEWDSIDAQCAPLLTERDKRYLPQMKDNQQNLFPTYNSAYTQQREKLLMKANLANIRREPGYYLKTRLYTLIRLWVTGVQMNAWREATTPFAKLKVVYPALVSAATFVLALGSIGWVLVRRRVVNGTFIWWLSLALVVYFGLVHLPFAIQARYTVPVRPWLLLATAIAVAAWLTRRHELSAPPAVAK
ncbi:hypothetical protein [Hymenobacter metallicola]|uniref:Glycosyltransferase RgtA/B/C/D-like domain-containing protein n=1 Tax=Hymenobacter metallicola TaxID=2563114 RepID=A0A4Z0Q124_9BACT|nr:hypothetical protein [Hymenobacter metallicola]TGE23216.1 hypothetical protein E5K02_18620 [Hymenobacter metallicola]